MKVPKIAEEEALVDPTIAMKEELKTVQRDLANPLGKENRVVSQWTKNFTKVADFRFPDLFIQLVGTVPVYNSESLQIYKSTNLYWGKNYFLMNMWKNFGITHLNPILITVI